MAAYQAVSRNLDIYISALVGSSPPSQLTKDNREKTKKVLLTHRPHMGRNRKAS